MRTIQNAWTYPRFELRDFLVGEGVRLSDDRDQVDASVQLAHELDVDGLQPVQGRYGVL